MSRPQPRELTVLKKTYITSHMLRVTLGGENISTIPENHESGYVKLIFPTEGQKPLVRTYTIRQQDKNSIDIDFVLHGDGGPASNWAQNAKVNDTILVGGPGPRKLIEQDADFFLLVGDMTALPAISVNLANLPTDAKGFAVIEVVDKDDIQNLAHPQGIEIRWVVNSHPGEDTLAILNEVKKLTLPKGCFAVWAACEFGSMKALRAYFKEELGVAKDKLYISSYWKLGSNEDEHKEVKRIDSVEVA